MKVNELLKAKGEQLKEARCYNEMNGQVSGGTLATIFNSLLNRKIYKSKLGFDPLLKTLNGTKSTNKFSTKNQMLLGYSKEFKSWHGFSLMASVIANCVKRSNAINNYNTNTFTYKESMIFKNFFEGFSTSVGLVNFASLLLIPPLRWMLRSFVLPKPGEGPTDKQMDEGYLKVTCIGEGSEGLYILYIYIYIILFILLLSLLLLRWKGTCYYFI